MKIDNKYELEEVVYLVTDRDQYERVITGIHFYPNNQII